MGHAVEFTPNILEIHNNGHCAFGVLSIVVLPVFDYYFPIDEVEEYFLD